MKEWFQRVLDPKGDQSATRLVLLWLVANATFMGWFIISFGTEYATEAITVMGGVTAIAGALKYLQKNQENQNQKP